MKKVLYSLPVMIVLIIAFSLPVFAEFEDLSIFTRATGGIYDGDGDFVEKNIGFFHNQPDDLHSQIRILHSVNGELYTGFRLNLISQGYVRVDAGYYFEYQLMMESDVYDISKFDPHAYVISSDDTIYELKVSWSPESFSSHGTINISIGGRVGDGFPLHFGTLVLDFKGIGSAMQGTGAYIIWCSNSISVVPTPEQLRHDELIGEIQNVTDELKNEDFGYTTPDSELGVIDDLSDTNTFIGGIADGINDMYDQIGDGFESFFFENPAMDVLWCWFGVDRIFIYTIVFSSMTFLFIRKLVK